MSHQNNFTCAAPASLRIVNINVGEGCPKSSCTLWIIGLMSRAATLVLILNVDIHSWTDCALCHLLHLFEDMQNKLAPLQVPSILPLPGWWFPTSPVLTRPMLAITTILFQVTLIRVARPPRAFMPLLNSHENVVAQPVAQYEVRFNRRP